ncbi:MAG: hypothetical protein ABII80_01430 [bacterium]
MRKYLIAFLLLGLSFVHPQSAFGFDPREVKMRLVLERYNSPLVDLSSVLIETAEKYDLDWTLLAAIAGTESSFAKRMPESCINPYGWGIYGDHRICFESLEKSIMEVGEGIGTKYNTSSLLAIARTYNTVSTDSWLSHTTFFMNKIKNQEIPVSALPITL